MAPNMSIYRQDADGNDTDEFYIMLPTNTSNKTLGSTVSGYSDSKMSAIRDLGNPVAIAKQAWRDQKTYRITPELQLDYELLGKNDDETRLTYRGKIYMDVFAESDPKFWPGSLTTDGIGSPTTYNRAENYDYNSLAFTTTHRLMFTPHFKNEDYSMIMQAQWQLKMGNSNNQNVVAFMLPNGITSTTVDAPTPTGGMTSGNGQWRNINAFFSTHFSYKSVISLDFTMRADGSTKFGSGSKWGYFPGISARWNISDMKFMDFTNKWLSMLSFRPSWGITGNEPGSEYTYFSKYVTDGQYGPGSGNKAVTYVDGMKLANLKWEKTTQYNIGGDFGFFDDLIEGNIEYYNRKTTNLLMAGTGIPTSTGFSSLSWKNVGTLRNKGWELNIDANKFLKIGKFSMSMNFNIAQNFNEILEMDETVLESINSKWSASDRGKYLNRIQKGNAVGSIYGLRYKGVYQYSYEWLTNYKTNNNLTDEEFRDYINNNFLASGKTAPVAIDDQGHVLMTSTGIPVHMVYNYDNDNGSSTYTFQGGDAIYEDINHDGQINSLDIVYLGNSNPKVNGGFGFNFYYGKWTLKCSFMYRFGNKVVNTAKMNLEKMYDAYNQSSAVNWRWRKNGDVTTMPRAMFDTGYNWLGSDRYVEDGSFVRFQYCQLTYSFEPKWLKQVGLNTLRLAASANNLFCWSKYSGTDPEHSPGSWGICYDSSQTPRNKSFTVSINIGF